MSLNRRTLGSQNSEGRKDATLQATNVEFQFLEIIKTLGWKG